MTSLRSASSPVQTLPVSESLDTDFGLRVYEALTAASRRAPVLGALDYATIQKLKAADRRGVAELFAGSDDALLACIETGTARDVADHLALVRERKGLAILAGLSLLDWPFL